MVDLLPGAAVDNVIALLDDAARTGCNQLGRSLSGVDLLNAYREWANQHARNLSRAITRDSLADLLLTRGYERLMQLDPRAFGNAVATVTLVEFEAAIAGLKSASTAVRCRQKAWADFTNRAPDTPLSVVILDTNVLLRRAERLLDMDWAAGLQQAVHLPVALAVPMVVVEELDKLKTSTGRMLVDDDEVPTKQLARAALRVLDETFDEDNSRQLLRERTPENHPASDLWIGLLIDDLRHSRLRDNDAEIIDRSLALKPYAATIALATGDRSMRFRARHASLVAFDPAPAATRNVR